MKTTQNLIRRIRLKQLLVCAYGDPATGERRSFSLEEIANVLQLTGPVCEMLARRLSARGLVQIMEGEPGLSISLTVRGEQFLARMATRPA